MKNIPLTQGKFALIDDADYEWASQYKWHFTTNGYARRVAKDRTTPRMHREINKTPNGMDTDHINGDKLDNRRENLRSVTRSQNVMNLVKGKKGKKYKGTQYLKRSGKYNAMICLNGKNQFIGNYDTEEEAALAYNLKAVELFGEFSCINKLPNQFSATEI